MHVLKERRLVVSRIRPKEPNETEELINFMTSSSVHVEKMDRMALDSAVAREYRKRGHPYIYCLGDVPEAVANRWTTNYIRHNLTMYDEIIKSELAGKVGRDAAHAILKNKILWEIIKKYPHLREECTRQHEELWEGEQKWKSNP